jgi:hypothetical protein
MIEKAVIFVTTDRVGICPEAIYNQDKLPVWVSIRKDLTRFELSRLFELYDLDQAKDTDRFWQKLVWYIVDDILDWVENDKVIQRNAHWPYWDTDFIR